MGALLHTASHHIRAIYSEQRASWTLGQCPPELWPFLLERRCSVWGCWDPDSPELSGGTVLQGGIQECFLPGHWRAKSY